MHQTAAARIGLGVQATGPHVLFSNSLCPPNTHRAFLVSHCSPANRLGRDWLYTFNIIIKCNIKAIFIFLTSDQAPNLLLFLVETHPDLTASEEDEFLKAITICLQVKQANKVGLLWSTEPVHITGKNNN